MRSIVVYYSRAGKNYTSKGIVDIEKGNTKVVAEKVAKLVGCDIFEIVMKESYSNEYHKCTEQAKADKMSGARPAIESYCDLAKYNNVILCYPNFWGTMPMCVYTFLEGVNTDSKSIFPICTHEGSGLGSSENDLRRLLKNANVQKGLAIRGSDVNIADTEIKNWLKASKLI